MKTESDIACTLANLKTVAPAGFAIGLHVRFTTPTFMFETYPKAWHEEYSRDGLLLRDPMVSWGFANQGCITWEELQLSDEFGVLPRAAAHGLRHGIAVSVLRGNSRSIGGFARSDRPFSADEVKELEAAIVELHDSTAATTNLSEGLRASLHRLSVAFTHP